MKILGTQQNIWFICLTLLNSWCYCQSAFFKLEHEDTSIVKTNEVQPFLDESVESEMECYMKCLSKQDNCCVIELKEKTGKVIQCLLYNTSSVNIDMASEQHSKIASVTKDCKSKKNQKLKSCLEWYQNGEKENGVYEIDVNGKSTEVFCDMAGGGWTIFQRRFDGSVNFDRTWNEYKDGFGDANGEHWLGNDRIQELTKKPNSTLIKFEATDFENVTKYIISNGFKIEGEENKYKMHIGDAVEGDTFLMKYKKRITYNNGSYFSTLDEDNDNTDSRHCAVQFTGGYWYNTCSYLTPNSGYSDGRCDKYRCMRWKGWKEESDITPLKIFQMSIK